MKHIFSLASLINTIVFVLFARESVSFTINYQSFHVGNSVTKLPMSRTSNGTPTTVVIGGGVSGLVAAATVASGAPSQKVLLLEAQDRVGGRVQTDVTESFRFDRGFAVFLEEYPMAQQLLDFDALDLRPFVPGAIIQTNKWGKVRIADPLRQISSLWDALRFPIGTLLDRINIARLVLHVRINTIQELFAEGETNTEQALRGRWKFSDSMIDQFFRPFLQGIYVCSLDQQSSRMFHFVFKMFSRGRVSLPALGMAAVSEQLLEKCIAARVEVLCNTEVDDITKQPDGSFRVSCNGGLKTFEASKVVVATESPVTHHLLQSMLGLEPDTRTQRAIGCLYYSFKDKPPIDEPILMLNGTGQGPVNNLCFPSVVSPSYTIQEGTHLCSVTVTEHFLQDNDDNLLDQKVRQQLSEWFAADSTIADWKLERIYRIPNAQPAQFQPGCSDLSSVYPRCDMYRSRKLPPGLLVCGDHMATASLQGALTSGLRSGELLLSQK